MGNAKSSYRTGALHVAVASMSHVIKFSHEQLHELYKSCATLSEQDGNENREITRKQLHIAMDSLGLLEKDKFILDRMFTLLDEYGEDIVGYRDLLSGACLLPKGSLEDRFREACHMFDAEKVSKPVLLEVLMNLNRTVSFFGDEALTDRVLGGVVEDIAAQPEGSEDGLVIDDIAGAFVDHPAVRQFIRTDPSAVPVPKAQDNPFLEEQQAGAVAAEAPKEEAEGSQEGKGAEASPRAVAEAPAQGSTGAAAQEPGSSNAARGNDATPQLEEGSDAERATERN